MKTTLISALFVAASLTGAGFGQQAGDDHGAHHGEQGETQAAEGHSGGHGHMMTGGMNMQAHQDHMARMRQLMDEARNSEDPEERRRLMAEHRDAMRARMDAMMADGDHGAMMERCAQHMSMMHDMMEQMMARQEMMEPPADADGGE